MVSRQEDSCYFRCPDCPFNEDDPIQFTNHLSDHQKTKILSCCFCKYKSNVYWMGLHMTEHSSDSTFLSRTMLLNEQEALVRRRGDNRSEPRKEPDWLGLQQVEPHAESVYMDQTKCVCPIPETLHHRVLSSSQAAEQVTTRRSSQRNSSIESDPSCANRHDSFTSATFVSDHQAGLRDVANEPKSTSPPPRKIQKCDKFTFSALNESSLKINPPKHHPESRCEGAKVGLESSESTLRSKIFKCEKCTFSALNKSLLLFHSSKHHTPLKRDDVKPEIRDSLESLQRSLFTCSKCAFATHEKTLFERHTAKHLIDPSFICTICGFKNISSAVFGKHLATKHSSRRQLRCCFCDYFSPKLENLRSHVERRHRPVKMAECPECGLEFSRKDRLNMHLQKCHSKSTEGDGNVLRNTSAHPKGPKTDVINKAAPSSFAVRNGPNSSSQHRQVFKCVERAFKTPKQHALKRRSAKRRICWNLVCTLCGFKDASLGNFAIHVATNHSTDEGYQCCFCCYFTPKLSQLAAHLKIHQNVKITYCTECKMEFSRRDRLRLHFRKVHSKSKKAVAGIGGQTKQAHRRDRQSGVANETALSVAEIASHDVATAPPTGAISPSSGCPPIISSSEVATVERVHGVSSKPVYQCNSCNFSSKRKDLLKLHVAKHLLPGSSLVCPLCQFSESSALKFVGHLMSHKSRNRLQCCFCVKIFPTLKDLKRHIEVHRKVHFHDCPVCGKTYTSFKMLRKHCEKTHVHCPDCGKLTTNAKLRSHLRKHQTELQKLVKSEFLKPDMVSSLDAKGAMELEQHQETKVLQSEIIVSPKAESTRSSDISTLSYNPWTNGGRILNPAAAYKCDYCDYSTDIEQLHARHVVKHDAEEAKFICTTCQFKSSEVLSFTIHLASHFGRFKCCYCCFSSTRKSELSRHLESHRLVHFHDCPSCEKSYAHHSSFASHYFKLHIKSKECPDCGQCMTSYSELLEHVKIHGKSVDSKRDSIARELNSSFGTTVELKNLSDTIGTFMTGAETHDPSMFHCHNCQFSTLKKSLLRRHAVKHLMDTRIVCPDCNFGDNNARRFAKHCQTCRGGFTCTICSYSTTGLKYLGEHVQRHRSIPICDCTQCEFSSSTQHNLREHFKTMHVALHQCAYCDKVMTRYKLNRHRAKHLAVARSSHSADSKQTTLLDGAFEPTKDFDNTLEGGMENLPASSDPKSLPAVEHLSKDMVQDVSAVKLKPSSWQSPECGGRQNPLLCGYCDFTSSDQPLMIEHLAAHAHLSSVMIKPEPLEPEGPASDCTLGPADLAFEPNTLDSEYLAFRQNADPEELGVYRNPEPENRALESDSLDLVLEHSPDPVALAVDPDSDWLAPKDLAFEPNPDPGSPQDGSEMDIEIPENSSKTAQGLPRFPLTDDISELDMCIDYELSSSSFP